MPPSNKAYRFSPRAIVDLEEIWAYTSETWSPEQADTYHRKIISILERLCVGHVAGRSCDDIRQGYFKVSALSHVIFYRKQVYGYEIIRILHQSMDLPKHL